MLYPSCYVFVVQDDVSNMMVQQQHQQQQQQPNPAVLSPMPMAANLNVLSPMPMAATPGQSYPNTTQGMLSFSISLKWSFLWLNEACEAHFTQILVV